MTISPPPSKFWTEVVQLLARAHKNESWLARRLEVPAQTLSSWKQRNQFRRGCLDQLGELLHWDGLNEELAGGLGVELIESRVAPKVETHPTEEALRRINREYRVAEKTFKRYAGQTLRLLHTLGEHCFYAFTAPTNTPYEFENTPEGHGLEVAIAKAICKGTLCLYIRPTEEGVSYYRDTWSYGQLVYHKQAMEELVAFRAQISGWMVRGDMEGIPKMSGCRSRSDPPRTARPVLRHALADVDARGQLEHDRMDLRS